MTVAQAWAEIDALKPNAYTDAQKRRWLSELEGIAADEIFGSGETFLPIGEADGALELAIAEPYCDVYLKYLEAQMDFHNGDFARCNNALGMFNALYAAFAASYRRGTLPGARTRISL